uniref:SOSEKI DIX-like domain-containing protein n=1 Tax=Triticum urartu TaxID=4572 RepID=A0A8R7RGV3_TRIUA
MEVTLASLQGLYLRDVIGRLDAVRGKGMAAKYSWSCKRSYKTGFVWHDHYADDLLLPTQGTEYVLKGSQLPFDQSKPMPMPDHQQKGCQHSILPWLPQIRKFVKNKYRSSKKRVRKRFGKRHTPKKHGKGLGMFFHLTYFKYFVGYVQRQRAGGKFIDEQRDGGMEQFSSAYKLDIFDESSPN